MENHLLRNPEVYPNEEVLRESLGLGFETYKKFTDLITGDGFDLTIQWNYYKDGKAWLCKVCYKKKTIFWLSVWEGYFKVSFYFNQNNYSGLFDLDINEDIKQDFRSCKSIGKLMPLTINIQKVEHLEDIMKIILYKKGEK